MNRQAIFGSALCGVFLIGTLAEADAATIRVRCEQRGDRSKVSVDGNDLRRGRFKARIYSGPNRAGSAYQHTVGDEVEFDFDSEPDDIAAGATAIDTDFIRNNEVRAKIVNRRNHTVISDTVTCRRR
jgi:hypothetical protein